MKKTKGSLSFFIELALFIVFTILVLCFDVQNIGPLNSQVGFASINKAFNNLFPFNQTFFNLSEYLGYICVATAGIFGIIWAVKFLSKDKMDVRIKSLVPYYGLLAVLYVLFNFVAINYRPILEEGQLAVSYPSSHVLLAVSVMSNAIIQIDWMIKSKTTKTVLKTICIIVMISTVVLRTISGVHWISDIVGGLILSGILISSYSWAIE